MDYRLVVLQHHRHQHAHMWLLTRTSLPGLKFPVVLAQVPVVDLQTGPLPGQAVQRASDIRQLLLVKPPHVAHLPSCRLVLLLQLTQHGGALALQLLDPLDVVGEAVVELSKLIFLVDAGPAGRADAGGGQAGGRAAAGCVAAGAAAGGEGDGGGRGHDGAPSQVILRSDLVRSE